MHPGRRDGRRARAARGSLAASIATATAATAHTLSGGGAPPPWLLIAVTALAAPLAVWLAGRALSVWRTAAVVALSQSLLHVAFAAVGSSAAAGFAESGAGHAHHPVLLPALASPAATPSIDPPMLLGHIVAAVVTVALLVHGERLARALGRGIRRMLAPVIGRIALPRAPRLRTLARRRTFSAPPFHTTLSRRGPPALAR